jgi:hypothetical protein
MPGFENPPVARPVGDESAPAGREVERTALTRTPPRGYAAIGLPVVLVILAATLQPWLRPTDLLRDSQAVAIAHGDTSTAYGLVSNLGIVAVVLAAGAALLAWTVARRTDPELAAVLTWMSALSLALALDDLLLLHETTAIAPWSGAIVVAAYGVALVAFVARFQGVIRGRLDVGLLLLAGAALAASAIVDLVAAPTLLTVVAEDGFKLLGLVAWSVFVDRTALLAVRPTAAAIPGPHARTTAE